jgi:hypothetical protein
MDLNYILGREQVSLHNARVAASSCARASHEGLARAYGVLLAESLFPHRQPLEIHDVALAEDNSDRWDDDGGMPLADVYIHSAAVLPVADTESAEPVYYNYPNQSLLHLSVTPEVSVDCKTLEAGDSRITGLWSNRATVRPPFPYDEALNDLVKRVEGNERKLAQQFSEGNVGEKSFQTRSRFIRQDRAGLAALVLKNEQHSCAEKNTPLQGYEQLAERELELARLSITAASRDDHLDLAAWYAHLAEDQSRFRD